MREKMRRVYSRGREQFFRIRQLFRIRREGGKVNKTDNGKLQAFLEQHFSPARWRHSQGVALAARKMALRCGVEPSRAELAGWLHDYARDLEERVLLEIGEENGFVTHPVERWVPELLHGPVGAYLVQRDLGINDAEVLRAIAVHTLGAEEMSILDKIVYIADLIEEGRDYPGVEKLRALAEEDLDRALVACFDQTLRYCLERGFYLHPRTLEARNAALFALRHNVVK